MVKGSPPLTLPTTPSQFDRSSGYGPLLQPERHRAHIECFEISVAHFRLAVEPAEKSDLAIEARPRVDRRFFVAELAKDLARLFLQDLGGIWPLGDVKQLTARIENGDRHEPGDQGGQQRPGHRRCQRSTTTRAAPPSPARAFRRLPERRPADRPRAGRPPRREQTAGADQALLRGTAGSPARPPERGSRHGSTVLLVEKRADRWRR